MYQMNSGGDRPTLLGALGRGLRAIISAGSVSVVEVLGDDERRLAAARAARERRAAKGKGPARIDEALEHDWDDASSWRGAMDAARSKAKAATWLTGGSSDWEDGAAAWRAGGGGGSGRSSGSGSAAGAAPDLPRVSASSASTQSRADVGSAGSGAGPSTSGAGL